MRAPYNEALELIERHTGTGGATGFCQPSRG
jgi:hypothetical protein